MPQDDPGENEYVKVTAPDEDEGAEKHTDPLAAEERPSSAHELKHEKEAPHEPLHERVPTPLHNGGEGGPPPQTQEGIGPSREREHAPEPEGGRETPDLRMPGSFDMSGEESQHHHHHHVWEGGWMGLFKKLHIKQ